MFTAKNAQYLTANNENISPMTNIESLYYEKATKEDADSANFKIERKSIVKHMPIGIYCNNVSILSTSEQLHSDSDKFNIIDSDKFSTFKDGSKGNDLMLAYVKETTLKHNISVKREDIYTQKYNLTEILNSYVTKYQYNESYLNQLEDIYNINIDKSYITIKEDAIQLISNAQYNVGQFVIDVSNKSNYVDSSIYSYNNINKIKLDSSLNLYKYKMSYPSDISLNSFYRNSPINLTIYLQPTSTSTFANQAVAIDENGNKYDIAFDFNIVGKETDYIVISKEATNGNIENILYKKASLEEVQKYYVFNTMLGERNIKDIDITGASTDNLYIKANCSYKLDFTNGNNIDILNFKNNKITYFQMKYSERFSKVYLINAEEPYEIKKISIVRHTGIYYMKDNKGNEAPYDFLNCEMIGLEIDPNTSMPYGSNNVIKTTNYVKIVGESNNNYVDGSNIYICGNNNKIINSYNVSCYNSQPNNVFNNIIMNSYNINLNAINSCKNNVIINSNNSNNDIADITNVINNKLLNVSQIKTKEIKNNVICNASILNAGALNNCEIINSTNVNSSFNVVYSNNLNNVNIINSANISRQVDVNNTTILDFNTDTGLVNPYNNKVYFNGIIHLAGKVPDESTGISLDSVNNYFNLVFLRTFIYVENDSISITTYTTGPAKYIYIDTKYRPYFNRGLYTYVRKENFFYDVFNNDEYYIYYNILDEKIYSYIFNSLIDGTESYDTSEEIKQLRCYSTLTKTCIKIINKYEDFYGKLTFTIKNCSEGFTNEVFREKITINFYNSKNEIVKDLFKYMYIPKINFKPGWVENEGTYDPGVFVIDLYGTNKTSMADNYYTMEIIYHKSENEDIYKYIKINCYYFK